MSPRRGLTSESVVDAAVAIVDLEGPDALTLSRVAAELGVKAPSLYNHVDGLESLRRAVALRAVEDMASALGGAAMGRAGADALAAVAAAFRTYAVEHPGRYGMTTRARPDDEEFHAASMKPVEPVLAILRGYDIEGDEAIHAARALRSALHGFVSLETGGGFGLGVDVDESYEWLVRSLSIVIAAQSDEGVAAE